MRAKDFLNKQPVNEGIDIGQEWMSDTELDQYVPRNLQQKWRELLGYDRYGRPSEMWVAHTDNYQPDSRIPEHRRAMVELANWWFYLKQIPNFEFFDVRDANNDDELEWLVQVGPPGWLPPHKRNVNEFAPGEGYRGDGNNGSISWERARAVFAQFAEDSDALGYKEKDNGNTVEIFWGPELGYPHDYFGLYVSPHSEHAMQGMLLGIHSDKRVEELKKFMLPMTMNGVDTAARYYMELRS